MNAADAARFFAVQHVPSAEELRRPLGELGEGLAGQLAELQARPDPDRCERLALNLEGARRMILTLRERLIAEGGEGDGQ